MSSPRMPILLDPEKKENPCRSALAEFFCCWIKCDVRLVPALWG